MIARFSTSTAVANGAVFNYHVEINGAKQSNLQPLFYIKSGTEIRLLIFRTFIHSRSIGAAIAPFTIQWLLYKTIMCCLIEGMD